MADRRGPRGRGRTPVDEPLWGDDAPRPRAAGAPPTGRGDGPGSDGSEPDGSWGPTVAGGGRGRRPWRIVVAVVAIVTLLVAGYAVALAVHAVSSIERLEVGGLEPSLSGPLNVLVVGNDSREGLTDEQRRELTTGSFEGARTDTIFILSVQGGRAAILAFPRDLYVERCDGTTGRINAALSIGGATCLVETVRDLSGIPIDDYIEVSLGGFTQIVESVDGVRLCLDAPIADQDAGIDLPAGCQVLDGPDALGYVRVRKIDSDLERIKRQQQFVAALAAEVLSRDTMTSPIRLWRTAGAIGGSLRADEGLGVLDLVRLARGGQGIAGGDVISETVPADGATIDGAAVLVPQAGPAEDLFREFSSGDVHDRPLVSVEPADVDVIVLNGAGVQGLAGRTADVLEVAGYRVLEIGNADTTATTTIRHAPGQRDAADLLASALPVEVDIVEDPEATSDVTLVLGEDAADAAF